MFYCCFSKVDKKLSYLLLCICSVLAVILIFQADRIIYAASYDEGREERLSYFSGRGYSVNGDSEKYEEIIFSSDEYYTALQKSQGYDVSIYIGKRVKKYTYELLDYPGYENREGMYASLFMYKNKVIASDICYVSVENGFIEGVTAADYGKNKTG